MNLIKPVFWAVSVLMAFVAGYYLAAPKLSSPGPIQSDIVSTPTSTLTTTGLQSSAISINSSVNSTTSDETTAKQEDLAQADLPLQKMIGKLLYELSSDDGEATDYAQLAKAWGVISKLDEGQLYDALLFLQSDAKNGENRELLAMVLTEYTRYAPEQAMSLMEQTNDDMSMKSFYARKVLTQWSKQEPQSAFNWYLQNKNNYQRYSTGFISGLFKALAANDIYDAVDKLNSLSTSRFTVQRAVNAIATNLSDNDDFSAILEHASLQNNEQTNKAIVAEWASKDPYAAIEWLDNRNLISTDIQRTILNKWMFSSAENPAAAANWYMQQGLSDNSEKRVNDIMQNFARVDANAGLKWLNNSSLANKQNALFSLITSSAAMNPDFAIKSIPTIADEQQQRIASARLYRTLSRNDPQKAQSFANSSPFKDELLQTNSQRKKGS